MSHTPLILHLSPTGPYDLHSTLQFWLRSPAELLTRKVEETYERVIPVDGAYVHCRIRSILDEIEVTATTLGPRLNPADATSVGQTLARLLGIQVPLEDFYSSIREDEVLSNLARELRGLRIPQFPSAFEALVWAIVGQQINLSFAHELKRRLVVTFGEQLIVDDQTYFVFPHPERLAAASVEQMRALSFSRQKASYIRELAQAVCSKHMDLAELAALPRDVARERLIALRGIGGWTADYALMMGMGRTDALPAADLGLRQAIAYFYERETVSEKEVRELAARWRGWESYATFYLWFALRRVRERKTT